jgi:glycosyltransferase involved in cell wall biosynthesis
MGGALRRGDRRRPRKAQPGMSGPLVSIVIPTKDGSDTLPDVFDALARQQTAFSFEVVAVDSGSTDGTIDLLRDRADRLVVIDAAEFDHGLTRNLGIEHSRGELIVLLVQDAIPASETWLAELVSPMADPAVAGTFARQIPRPHASAITKHYHARWVTASDAPRVLAIHPGEIAALKPFERLMRCAFDNVCSCIRRTVWMRHPFRATPIGEDIEWAREVLLDGYRLVYAPRAAVIHSHDRPARYELARTYALHRRLYDLFQLRTIPSVWLLVRAVGTSSMTHLRVHLTSPAPQRAAGMRRALSLAVAWPLGQYLGGLSAAKGWKLRRLRNV